MTTNYEKIKAIIDKDYIDIDCRKECPLYNTVFCEYSCFFEWLQQEAE